VPLVGPCNQKLFRNVSLLVETRRLTCQSFKAYACQALHEKFNYLGGHDKGEKNVRKCTNVYVLCFTFESTQKFNSRHQTLTLVTTKPQASCHQTLMWPPLLNLNYHYSP
jgi:hypothetical protein